MCEAKESLKSRMIRALLCGVIASVATVNCKRPSTEARAMVGDAAACKDGHWSSPRPLLNPLIPSSPVARSPALVADGSGLYVVGNDLPPNDQPVRIGATLTAWRVGRGSIGAPPGDFVFYSPKAALDAKGRLHVLWGEPATHGDTVPPYQWLLLGMSSIWTSVYEPDHGWSVPTRLYSGAIDWQRWTSGAISRGPDGVSLAAVPNEAGGVLA